MFVQPNPNVQFLPEFFFALQTFKSSSGNGKHCELQHHSKSKNIPGTA